MAFARFTVCAVAVALTASSLRAGVTLASQVVATGLTSPVMVTHAPNDPSRLFVVERAGRIRLIKNGALQGTAFLNITSLVTTNVERGLLDLVFHPNYAQSGYFYVRYNSTNGQTNIARYSVSANPDIASPTSAFPILIVEQGTFVHIGGSMAFGRDGYLYIGHGEGENLPNGNSQSLDIMLGKILRIDVNGDDFPADPQRNYRIPPGNPYAGSVKGLDEIWASGLRNPYRFAFDYATGNLWIADVGAGGPEEINFQPIGVAARNYGWPCMEGPDCTTNNACACDDPNLTLPIFHYAHIKFGCSITGGRVYRGCAIPELVGAYFFGDYCTGQVLSFRYDNGVITDFEGWINDLNPPGPETIDRIVGFGEDIYGELYIVDIGSSPTNSTDGAVFKIVPAIPTPDVNGNGVPDICEIGPGDADHNNTVNVNDLLAVIINWGPCVGCNADVAPHPGGNGVIDVNDLLMVITNWD